MSSKPQNKIASTVLNNRFKRKYISPKQVDKLNTHCNLIQLLIWWDESSIQYRRKQFVLRDTPRCVVYDTLVYDHYTGVTTNPISTLMTYYDMSFPQAVYVANYFLTKVSKLDMECYIQLEYIDKELFAADTGVDLNYILQADQTQSTLPDVKAAALRKVYAYLCNTRCIDRDLVTHFLKQKYIGLDASNLLCFYTYRGDDVIAVTKKGINPRITFKQNLVREKHTGFIYGSSTTTEFKEVFVFESCVDLLSFLNLAKRGHIPKLPMDACYISLNGASSRYLDKVLLEHPTIERIHFCTDNDNAGQLALTTFTMHTKNKMPVDSWLNYLVEAEVKDWNELLQLKEEENNLPF